MKPIPLHAYELIDELDESNPEEVFRPGTDRDEFLMRQGARRLVLTLLNRRKREAEDNIRGR